MSDSTHFILKIKYITDVRFGKDLNAEKNGREREKLAPVEGGVYNKNEAEKRGKNVNWITEENYDIVMRTVVEPYVAKRMESGLFSRVKGQPIYYEHYRPDTPKAVIVISHGFTESIRKYTESVYYMLQRGFEVWGLDHRGHGQSFRETDNPFVVHTGRFNNYVKDLRYLTKKYVRPSAGKLPVYLYVHSMGGCIGALIIEQYPKLFDRAVLSSPMLGLDFGKVPVPIVYMGAQMKSIGGKKALPITPKEAFEKADYENSCDSSRCRYEYYYRKRLADKNLQTSSASMGWGMEAAKACARARSAARTARISIPVLLIQAGKDTVVKNASQFLFASRVKSCRFFQVSGMKHELYMTDSEVLIPYWERVFQFLEK